MKRLIALLLVLLMLAGCSAPAGKTDSNGTAPAVAEGGRKGGKLVTAMFTEPITLEPASSTSANNSGRVVWNVFEGLVRHDADGKLVPHLAESFEYNEDKTVITFHLRKDVKFHNGDPLTAEDVKYSFDRAQSLGYNVEATGTFKETVVIDEHTVELRLTGPNVVALDNIAESRYLLIFNKKIAEERGDSINVNIAGAGTGPFKFKSWDTGVEIVLEANMDYWRGAPQLDEIVYRFIPEGSSMAIALETGDIDAALDISLVDAPHLKENKNLNITVFPTRWLYMFEMNLTKEPWNDENFRKAVASCINLDELILAVTQGTGIPHGSLTMADSFGYPGYEPIKQDYDKAREYLAASNYPNGCDVVFNATDGIYKNLGEVLQGMCAPIGINIKVEVTDGAALLATVMDNKHSILPMTGSGLCADADSELVDKVTTGSWGNFSRISDARIDELMQSARFEHDPELRLKEYLEVQEIVRDHCYIIPLYIASLACGCNANLKNFVPRADCMYDFFETSW